jgi:hypothetical protein
LAKTKEQLAGDLKQQLKVLEESSAGQNSLGEDQHPAAEPDLGCDMAVMFRRCIAAVPYFTSRVLTPAVLAPAPTYPMAPLVFAT